MLRPLALCHEDILQTKEAILGSSQTGKATLREVNRDRCRSSFDEHNAFNQGPTASSPGHRARAHSRDRSRRWHAVVLSGLGSRQSDRLLSSVGAELRYLGISAYRIDRAWLALHRLRPSWSWSV